jgi:hypothetical protein
MRERNDRDDPSGAAHGNLVKLTAVEIEVKDDHVATPTAPTCRARLVAFRHEDEV